MVSPVDYDIRSLIPDMRAVDAQWRAGPVRDHVVPAHERAILCMAAYKNRLVTGSADHGLKEFDLSFDATTRNRDVLQPPRKLRELFSKKFGHSEWVTCVAYTRDGRILSGAMDSKLCLWEPYSGSSSVAKCSELLGHTSSIAAVQVDDADVAISASYDSNLRVWNLSQQHSGASEVCTLQGHSKAVLCFAWRRSLVASGGRDAIVQLWDINSGKGVGQLRGHKQPVQCVDFCHAEDCNMVVTGSWDGQVRIWDLRDSKAAVATIDAHPKHHVNAIRTMSSAASSNGSYSWTSYDSVSEVSHAPAEADTILSGGSDGSVQVLDARRGWELRQTLTGHQSAVGCVAVRGGLVLSGAANGWVLVHDISSGECLYGIGASKEAVRCIEVLPERAAIGGDDGCAMVLDFFQ